MKVKNQDSTICLKELLWIIYFSELGKGWYALTQCAHGFIHHQQEYTANNVG